MTDFRDGAWCENRERNKKLYPYSFGEPPEIPMRWVKWHKPPTVRVLPDGSKSVEQLPMTPHNVGNNARKRLRRAGAQHSRKQKSAAKRLILADVRKRERQLAGLRQRDLKQALAAKRCEAREAAA